MTTLRLRRTLWRGLTVTAEWAAITVLGVLYITAWTMIGWFLAGFAHDLGADFWIGEFGMVVWVAAGITAAVLWLGWYTELIYFGRPRRLARQAVEDTIEWDPSELTDLAPIHGQLLAGAR